MEAYVHTLDPFAIKFTQDFGIRWYGLSYLTGFFLGYLIILWLCKKGKSPLSAELASDFVFTVAMGCIAGGRIGYCLFYSPDLLFSFESSPPFWGLLAVNKGGMASHGGMIGIVIACYYFARKHSLPVLHLFDLTIPGATLGIFFGRIANFINGELVGRVAPAGYQFAVKFPQDIINWPSYAPEKLKLLTPVIPYTGEDTSRWERALNSFPGRQAWHDVQFYLERILEATQSHNTAVIEHLAPLLSPRYPSQLLAALLEGLLIFVITLYVWRKPQKPGLVTALFFIVYALVRIYNEQFRLPDLHLGYQLFGLTRGQWLSVGLLIAGISCYAYWSRRKAPAIGGWRS